MEWKEVYDLWLGKSEKRVYLIYNHGEAFRVGVRQPPRGFMWPKSPSHLYSVEDAKSFARQLEEALPDWEELPKATEADREKLQVIALRVMKDPLSSRWKEVLDAPQVAAT